VQLGRQFGDSDAGKIPQKLIVCCICSAIKVELTKKLLFPRWTLRFVPPNE